jgi:hypothetical protein
MKPKTGLLLVRDKEVALAVEREIYYCAHLVYFYEDDMLTFFSFFEKKVICMVPFMVGQLSVL